MESTLIDKVMGDYLKEDSNDVVNPTETTPNSQENPVTGEPTEVPPVNANSGELQQVISDFVNALKEKYDIAALKDEIMGAVAKAIEGPGGEVGEVPVPGEEAAEGEEEVANTLEGDDLKEATKVFESTSKWMDEDLV